MPASPPPSASRAAERSPCALLLMLLAMSLTACGTRQARPSEMPEIPPPPALTEPLPSEPYSISARRDMAHWRQKLTDTPPTSKP